MTRDDLKTMAKAQLKGRWLIAIVAVIFCAIFTDGTVFEQINPFGEESGLSLSISVVTLLLGGVFSVGKSRFALNFTSREKAVEFKDVFSAFPIYLKTLGLNVLISIIVALGTILLIIPGIIAGLALSQSYFILAENPDCGVIECMKESIQTMKGHKWEYFVLLLSFIGWIIVCALTFGIGYIWLAPYMLMTKTNYYKYIKTGKDLDKWVIN